MSTDPENIESGKKMSFKIQTNSDASLGSPLWFNLPISNFVELSSPTTDKLTFYINSDSGRRF